MEVLVSLLGVREAGLRGPIPEKVLIELELYGRRIRVTETPFQYSDLEARG